jgi:hypothetical protein
MPKAAAPISCSEVSLLEEEEEKDTLLPFDDDDEEEEDGNSISESSCALQGRF